MDKILIHGGRPLSGSIKISGSKNSALPILAATLLTREPCTLHRVPDLSDTHYMLQILTHLGAQVERASGTVTVTAEKIESVAPYDVVRKMRAKIEGAGTRRLIIEGVKELHGAEQDVIPDRIEAGTFLVAGAICGKGVTVKRVVREHVSAVTDALTACGYKIQWAENSITVSPNGDTKPLELATEPYPGFPTDMQAQMCALLSTTGGISVITENVFPQRYMHVAELKRMGAHVDLEGPTAVIQGVDRRFGAPVMASDLRASAALVLAGLKADGITEVSRVYHIDRGYEHLDEKLSELGAQIERVQG